MIFADSAETALRAYFLTHQHGPPCRNWLNTAV
jgi:hypothetical protein